MQNLSRRRFVATTLAAGATLALPSLSFAEGGSLADIKKRGKLTVGTEPPTNRLNSWRTARSSATATTSSS